MKPAPDNQSTDLPKETPLVEALAVPMTNAKGWRLAVDDWVWLNPGYRVGIHRMKEGIVSGVVDIIAPDASIFWVWLDDARGRIAIHEDDAVVVWFEGDGRLDECQSDRF